ncbi:MAG: isocitrate lyase/PEP mutase family protein [Rhodospirillaceae bacterium]|nr:isocitrate lyase/PEP mutase family protein [Rhodospirillaceae bacterium]
MSHAQALRALLKGPGVIVAPGMYDALTAHLIAQRNFSCAYLSGASISYSRIGRPDVGLVSLAEVGDVVSHIRERVEIPIIVDADAGFGNALNAQRAVRLLERMGASGIQIEDQTNPKRCGNPADKTLIASAEMVGKIKAAVDARTDPNTVIVARTDAVAVEGFDRAIERANALADAGADMLFVEGPMTLAQMKALGVAFAGRIPLLANMLEGGRMPVATAAELGAIGFKLVIFPAAMARIVSFAAGEYLDALKADGATTRLQSRMVGFDQLNADLGIEALLADGLRYEK